MTTNIDYDKLTGYLKISNLGEIDPIAFSLLGASTKREDRSKIGFFGSGLKYAIAVLLREKIPFTVYSGNKKIEINTKSTKLRDKRFNLIQIDGKPTSLTTEMGPTWKPWYAIREIFCNAIDEEGHEIGLAGEPQPVEGSTVFYIGINSKLKEVLNDWNYYFSEKRSDMIHSDIDVKFFQGSKQTIVYRKGVQVYTASQRSLFHYDCKDLVINESRVLESDWELKYNVCKQLARHATVEMISEFFRNYRDSIEENFYWEHMDHSFNKNWITAIDDQWLVPSEFAGNFLEEMAEKRCLLLPKKLIDSLVNTFSTKIKVIGIVNEEGEVLREADQKQKDYINEAVVFLNKAGINISYPIKIIDFKAKNVLGRAKNETILLSPKLFTLGKKMIVSTILEEYSHLDTGYGDGTRSMQDFLFTKIVTLMEEKTGITL